MTGRPAKSGSAGPDLTGPAFSVRKKTLRPFLLNPGAVPGQVQSPSRVNGPAETRWPSEPHTGTLAGQPPCERAVAEIGSDDSA